MIRTSIKCKHGLKTLFHNFAKIILILQTFFDLCLLAKKARFLRKNDDKFDL